MEYTWAEVDREINFEEGKANLPEAPAERWSLKVTEKIAASEFKNIGKYPLRRSSK